MEKSFVISKESKYSKAWSKHIENIKGQKKLINEFFENKGIEANDYYISGDGLVNQPFNEYEKNEIRLSIKPTENDLTKFGKMLGKSKKYGLNTFRKNSIITKEFAQECIDKQIVINLFMPRPSDYFKSLEYGIYGCSYEQFKYNDKLYLKIESEYLKDNDIPEGFKEIKTSEFYQIKEMNSLKEDA